MFYIKGADDALYRRRDGDPDQLPEETLTRSGWMPLIGQLTISATTYPRPSRRGTADGGADPALWNDILRVSYDEAQRWAAQNGRPTSW